MVRKLKIPSQINHIIVAQCFITLCITGGLFVFKTEIALSAFLGGIICVLPNLYFAGQLFTKRRNAEPHSLLLSIYIAELIKIGLAITLFAIVFINYKEAHPLIILITYFIVQSCMWIVPLFESKPKKQTIKQTI